MGVASGPAGGRARDPDPAPARDAASPQGTGAALGTPGGMLALQRAIGNAATGRLLRSAEGRRALARWPYSLGPDEPITVERTYEPDPSLFVKPMTAPAEREKLGVGDHVWYYDGNVSDANEELPRTRWFPHSKGASDYEGHGREIFQYVVYADHVMEGQPHMRGGPGTYAWINNNPGNLTGGGVGEISGKKNWHGFLKFATYQQGYDAIPVWLKNNSYMGMGILAAFERYAPRKDGNDPEKYANDVVRKVGGGATLTTTLQEIADQGKMDLVQQGIKEAEGSIEGRELPRGDSRIPEAVRNFM